MILGLRNLELRDDNNYDVLFPFLNVRFFFIFENRNKNIIVVERGWLILRISFFSIRHRVINYYYFIINSLWTGILKSRMDEKDDTSMHAAYGNIPLISMISRRIINEIILTNKEAMQILQNGPVTRSKFSVTCWSPIQASTFEFLLFILRLLYKISLFPIK